MSSNSVNNLNKKLPVEEKKENKVETPAQLGSTSDETKKPNAQVEKSPNSKSKSASKKKNAKKNGKAVQPKETEENVTNPAAEKNPKVVEEANGKSVSDNVTSSTANSPATLATPAATATPATHVTHAIPTAPVAPATVVFTPASTQANRSAQMNNSSNGNASFGAPTYYYPVNNTNPFSGSVYMNRQANDSYHMNNQPMNSPPVLTPTYLNHQQPNEQIPMNAQMVQNQAAPITNVQYVQLPATGQFMRGAPSNAQNQMGGTVPMNSQVFSGQQNMAAPNQFYQVAATVQYYHSSPNYPNGQLGPPINSPVSVQYLNPQLNYGQNQMPMNSPVMMGQQMNYQVPQGAAQYSRGGAPLNNQGQMYQQFRNPTGNGQYQNGATMSPQLQYGVRMCHQANGPQICSQTNGAQIGHQPNGPQMCQQMAQQNAQQTVQNTVQQTAQNTVQQTAQNKVQQTAQKLDPQAAQKIAQEAAQKIAQQAVQKSAPPTAQKTAEKTDEPQPTYKTVGTQTIPYIPRVTPTVGDKKKLPSVVVPKLVSEVKNKNAALALEKKNSGMKKSAPLKNPLENKTERIGDVIRETIEIQFVNGDLTIDSIRRLFMSVGKYTLNPKIKQAYYEATVEYYEMLANQENLIKELKKQRDEMMKNRKEKKTSE